VGQWRAELKEAYKAGDIRAADILYADELLAFPSVAWGADSMASDTTMGERLGVSPSTARRSRRRLDKAGRVEVRGYGRDGNSCLVRPILRDGTPVFPNPEKPTPPAISDRPPRSELTADLLKETLETEVPPLPPAAEPEAPAEPAVQAAQQAPAEPPAPTQPPVTETAPADTAQASAPQPDVEPAKPVMTFREFWIAFGQTGKEGYARAKWGRLSPGDKAAIRDRLRGPRSWAPDMWAGKWLECRVWEEPEAPTNRPAQVHIRENSAEWRAWQKHLIATRGRGTPTDSRGGWHFPSRLPPLPCPGKEGA
jgi:hypothetical protein